MQLYKRGSGIEVLLKSLRNFSEKVVCRTSPASLGDCFCKLFSLMKNQQNLLSLVEFFVGSNFYKHNLK